MDRRAFLKSAAALSAAAAASQMPGVAARAQQKEFAPRPGTCHPRRGHWDQRISSESDRSGQ